MAEFPPSTTEEDDTLSDLSDLGLGDYEQEDVDSPEESRMRRFGHNVLVPILKIALGVPVRAGEYAMQKAHNSKTRSKSLLARKWNYVKADARSMFGIEKKIPTENDGARLHRRLGRKALDALTTSIAKTYVAGEGALEKFRRAPRPAPEDQEPSNE